MNSGDKAHEMDEEDIFDARAAHERNRKKRYLITGITGFAGAHLAELLHKEGHEVVGLIRKSNGMESDILDVVSQECFDAIKFEYADITDYRSLDVLFKKYATPFGSFDGVYHLAAQSHPPTSFLHPLDTFNINVMGTANLIDVVALHCGTECKFMFCSTSEVYGNSGADGRHLKESDPLAPCNPYAVSKAASDLYMQERMMNKKINGFVTRAFSHTGPRRGRTFSISCDAYQIAEKMIAQHGSLKIDVGNLETVRTVIDVRDIVRAYYLLMMNPESSGKVFNVCGDTPRKMGFFTDFMIAESGFDIEKVISPKLYRPIDIAYQIGDTTAIRELTGWKPEIPIEQTLRDLLQYWLRKMQK